LGDEFGVEEPSRDGEDDEDLLEGHLFCCYWYWKLARDADDVLLDSARIRIYFLYYLEYFRC